MKGKFAMAIHGGAGTIGKGDMGAEMLLDHENGMRQGLEAGVAVLRAGGSSLDAVQRAVESLEDCALFNAGRGSVFSHKGLFEMDAAIMDGLTGAAGAVAGISNLKNPVKLARKILDKGDYVLLSGEQAEEYARYLELRFEPNEYFYTDFRHQEWQRVQADRETKTQKFGTVGAVALDSVGNLAAATSTGGLCNKRYGRIGDSCIIGAGTYANREVAVSCTGQGEAFIRAVAAHDIASLMAYTGISLKEASTKGLAKVGEFGGSGGLIAVDHRGHIEMPFSTEGMYRACYHPDGQVEVSIY